MRQCRDGTGRVAKYLIAALKLRCGRTPPCRQPSSQKLVVVRATIPHGDRRDGAKSRRIEYQVALIRPLDNDIVRVLVLGQDVGHRAGWLLRAQPCENIPEGALIFQLNLKGVDFAGCDRTSTTYGNFSQEDASLYA